jgi:CRP-like cAMP-binding protein
MAFSKSAAPNCDWCPHKKSCLYNFLGDAEARKAWREMRVASPFKAGEIIFHEGMPPPGVYVICNGRVKVYKSTRSAQQLTTRVELAGDLVGHITLLADEGPYTGTAEALESSVISMVDSKSFLAFLAKFPQAARALLMELARDVRRGENKARDIAYKSARSRIADSLLKITNSSKSYPLMINVRRTELAEMAGLTLETSVRTLKDFELRGLIKRQGKGILVLKEDDLRRLAGTAS